MKPIKQRLHEMLLDEDYWVYVDGRLAEPLQRQFDLDDVEEVLLDEQVRDRLYHSAALQLDELRGRLVPEEIGR